MEISIFFALIAIIALLLMSAFFSCAETAMTASSKALMVSREREGNKRAALVNRLRSKKDRMIGALLLGNNAVNILSSALATGVLIELFGDTGVLFATVVMTAAILIFSEVMPKTYALHNADNTALALAPFVKIVVLVFAPITEAVSWLVRFILNLFGVDISKVKSGSHLELLRGVIEMHKGPDEETKKQRAMLRSILDLADVTVYDVMIHRQNVMMIHADLNTQQIVEEVLSSPHTRIPIWKGNPDNIIGIIHAKLLLKEINAAGGDISKVDITSAVMLPWFIPETTDLYEQLQAFRARREHFAVVVDEYGVFEGVVTLEDILEEIVGDIDDEHDHSVPGVRKVGADTYLINGDVTIRDLNREFEWRLPDEEYATLAGLVLHESQRVPKMGQSFSFYGFRFDIIARQQNQITKIRMTKFH